MKTTMKIAVTFEQGNVFPHFGHSEAFKIYDIKEGHVVSSEVIDAAGSGHGALASLLVDNGVDVLICGGIGDGAVSALAMAGIEVCSGAEGNADSAVIAYLTGDLVSTGVNCDHHDHEDVEEAGAGCGGCGGGCGSSGGCGGCGNAMPQITGPNVGMACKLHYRGTLNDGTQFDSSYDRNEPLEFICGIGMMIYGFDKAVANMEVGQITNIHLMPEEAYGEPDPRMVFEILIKDLPGCEELEVGQRAFLTDTAGNPVPVKVIAKDDQFITFDANHDMAGKELNFKIELVSVETPDPNAMYY